MSAYATALHSVGLAGPTLFGKVINTAAEIAAQSLSSNTSKYYILLIITDGVLTDFQETVDALVRASDFPLSILIVGVGGADFTQMEILDAGNGHRLESSTGRIATRDIVQFVPMHEVHGCEQYCQHLKGLGEFKPEEGHANEEGLIEEVEEGESMTPHDPEECTEKVEEARKVEDIGPKENPPRRTHAQRETKEPLECYGQVGVVPEPTGLTNLSSSRQNGPKI
ncbi:hypothetical protein Ancab_001594 [Ancistrocladus abbreviatus]